MRVAILLALVAFIVMTIAVDISNMTDSIYKIPITEDGLFDYAGAINLAPKGPRPPGSPIVKARAVVRDDSAGTDDDDDDDDEYEDYDDGDIDSFGTPLEIGLGHCHRHFPHHHTKVIMGNITMDFASYPFTLAMFSMYSHILSSYFAALPQPYCRSVLPYSLPPFLPHE